MEKVLNKEILFKGRKLAIESVNIDFDNGKIADFERVVFVENNKNESLSCVVIPIDDDGYIYLVKQFQVGANEQQWVACKGGITSNNILNDVNKELMEEIGFFASKLIEITTIEALPSYVSLQTKVFVALELQKKSKIGDEVENTVVGKFRINDVIDMIFKAQIKDARTIATIFLLKEKYFKYLKY